MGKTGVELRMKLKVRVVHYRHDCWYADIDDAEDRQPDDPFWYADCSTQAEAIALACTQLAALESTNTTPRRLSETHAQVA